MVALVRSTLSKPPVSREACSDSMQLSNGDNVIRVSLLFTVGFKLFTGTFGTMTSFDCVTCTCAINKYKINQDYSKNNINIKSTQKALRIRPSSQSMSLRCHLSEDSLIKYLRYTVSEKNNQSTIILLITSTNVDRFSKFFHWQIHW